MERKTKKGLLKTIGIFALLFAFTAVSGCVKLYIAAPKAEVLDYAVLIGCFLLILAALMIYFVCSRGSLIVNLKELAAVCTAVGIGYAACVFLSLIGFFVVPLALTAFIIAPLSRRRDAFIGNAACVIMITASLAVEGAASGRAELSALIVLMTAGMFVGALASYTVSTGTKRISYVLKGVFIGLLQCALMLTAALCFFGADYTMGIVYLPFIAAASQVAAGLLFQPLLESVFNLLTNSRLAELTDSAAPLIGRLKSEAPGTYSHSLAVANFAEVCASAIGENPYLARACAYYHDVGKLINPSYFKENQADYNPHDEVLPEVSAEIIRGHTTEGLKLCEKYRVPKEISHVVVQHHGTLPIAVFYKKAQELTDSEVDIYEYSYHGITPRTKIAAILMICDSGEAAIRAMDKPDGEKVDALLKGLIEQRINLGQFEYCDVSLKDLTIIRQAIVDAFGGIYHKRLKYPDGK